MENKLAELVDLVKHLPEKSLDKAIEVLTKKKPSRKPRNKLTSALNTIAKSPLTILKNCLGTRTSWKVRW